jgi:hypothetical protein
MSDKHQVPGDKEIRTRIKEGRTIATEIIQDQIGKEVIIPVGKDIKHLNLNRFIVFENHFFYDAFYHAAIFIEDFSDRFLINHFDSNLFKEC